MACISKGVDGRKQEIEGDPPVRQDGEIRKGSLDSLDTTELLMCSLPGDVEEEDDECVQTLRRGLVGRR